MPMCYGSGSWCLSTWKVSLVMLRAVETFWEIFRICKTPGFLQHSWRLSIGDSYLGWGRYARGPQPRGPEETRSGTYARELWTQSGCICDLRVPKLRRGNGRLHWQTIERYKRCWGPFLAC